MKTTASTIRSLWADRCSVSEIAAWLGVSRQRVSGSLRRHAVKTYIGKDGLPRYRSNYSIISELEA